MSSSEIKTPALVLTTFPYEEGKRIAHLYTPILGRQSVLVSGPKSLRYFQRGALLTIRFYYRPQREIQRLMEADWLVLYQTLHHEVRRMPYLLMALEVLERVLVAPDERLFDLVQEGLLQLDTAAAPEEALKSFLAKLLGQLSGHPLPHSPDWTAIEAALTATLSDSRPLRTLSLLRVLSLPAHEGDT